MKYIYWISIPTLATVLALFATKSYLSRLSANELDKIKKSNESLTISHQLNSQIIVNDTNLYSHRYTPYISKSLDLKIQQQHILTQEIQASKTANEVEFQRFWKDFQKSIKPIISQRLTQEEISKKAAEQSVDIEKRLQTLNTTLTNTKQDRNIIEGTQIIGDLLKDERARKIISRLNQTKQP